MGDLIAEERRDVLVELLVPSGSAAPGQMLLLEASVRCVDVRREVQVQTPVVRMETTLCDEEQPEGEPNEDVRVQRERVEVTRALKEASQRSDQGQYDSAQEVIHKMEERVRSRKTRNCEAMSLELQDASARMADRLSWERGGRAEVSDAYFTHSMQRSSTLSENSMSARQSRSMYISSTQSLWIGKSRRHLG
eukprot:NODE_3376_length_794_cov_802.652233.p1 GENE.NODE_3376_length_794_cov_802.652233~~NODE_3376_length_794_cov_802.652233.p1  ORF type:complete len:193 (+),score=64.80 NODE_3376_length_794_cov_802.652233:3-581(+)